RGDSYSLQPNSASQDVRNRLRVEMYLEGSVEMAANTMRVIVQMIDSENGFHILSRKFDRPREEFFDVRDEVTNLTVANVRVALPPDIRASSLKVIEDPSLNAYALYRHGVEDTRRPTTIGTIASALGWFDASLNVDPDYAAAHAGKCGLYAKGYSEVDDASFITKAESSCATALALNPNLDMVHTALGDLYQSTGRYEDAENAYQEALSIDPSNVLAMSGLGRTYQRLNRLDGAEASLRKAVDVHPGDAAAYNTLGVFLFQTGRFDEAAAQYEYSVALDPGNMHRVSNLASAYMMQGDFESAAPAFQRAIDIEPTKNAYSNLGLMQYYLGDLDAAVHSLSAAVTLRPNDHLARSNLGDALWIADRRDEARNAFRTAETMALGALQVNPKDPLTLMDLAWIKTNLDRHTEARELIERAKKAVPDDPYVHYINGLMHNRLGETDDAIAAFEEAVELGYSTKLLLGDPNISSLKDDSRFKAILDLSE
ncbi:MAG: tetratricopeptide repeat protein, partial [Gammaproteobacteria bacterium]|nr:tetratricopeptide repeat protein [Gammaproteobacteria bacterium]